MSELTARDVGMTRGMISGRSFTPFSAILSFRPVLRRYGFARAMALKLSSPCLALFSINASAVSMPMLCSGRSKGRGMMRVIPLMVVGLILAGQVVAGDLPIAPPSPLVDPYSGAPTSKVAMAQSFAVAGTSFKLGGADIAKIPSRLGQGVVHEETADRSFRYICYDIPAAQQRVWLAVTDEMGDGRSVDMVTVTRLTSADPRSSSCSAIKSSRITIDGFVGIGATKSQLIQKLGQPSFTAGPWMVFRGESDSARQSITIRLDQDKVAFIYAANTSTD